MNSRDKIKVLLIEPSEIIAAGFKDIIGRNPDFTLVETLADPSYYSNIQRKADIIVINPAVINYNERFDIRSYFCSEGRIHPLWHSQTQDMRRA